MERLEGAACLEHLELAGQDARLRHVHERRGTEVVLHTQEAGPQIRLERQTARFRELVHLLVGLEEPQRHGVHLGKEGAWARLGMKRARWCALKGLALASSRLERLLREGSARRRTCPAHQKTFQSSAGGSVLWKP